MKAVAYCDGSGNSCYGACACTIEILNGSYLEFAELLGEVSNNTAEYRGVQLAIIRALENGVTELVINTDSQVIERQLRGVYMCKQPHLKVLRDETWEMAEVFEKIEIRWIRREQNARADQLCREIQREPGARRKPIRNDRKEFVDADEARFFAYEEIERIQDERA